jgi:hypothetical protein
MCSSSWHAQPDSYDFYCLIHPAMHGTVKVFEKVSADPRTGGIKPPG